MNRIFLATVSALCLGAATGHASAATIAVLSGDRTITLVDSTSWSATGEALD